LKVLVTYYTLSGNTEKIAKAIYAEVLKNNEADLKKIDEVNAAAFNKYDLIFVGTPAHAGDLAAPVKEIMNSLPNSPKYKLAGFYTHMSEIWQDQGHKGVRVAFERISKGKGIDYKGTYNCMGYPDPNVAKMVQEAQKIPDDKFNKYMEEAKKHPSPEDEQNAMKFAKKILSKK
jgi:flavodoxin